MENRKRLYRKCAYCRRILPVDNLDDWDWRDLDRWDNTVRWDSDPYDAEIHGDYTKMWLCGRDWDNKRDEI